VTGAGIGTPGFSGDGGPATSAQLVDPMSVAFGLGGALFIADSDHRLNASAIREAFTRIRRVDAQGMIMTVSGGGNVAPVDGAAANLVRFYSDSSLTTGPAGDLFVATGFDQIAHIVVRIDMNNGLHLIAGPNVSGFGNYSGYSGDGGPARDARLSKPRGLTVDSAGTIYFADSGNNVVRRIGATGMIETIAGDGQRGSVGEGIPATRAQFFAPLAVALSPDGSVYIADTNNHRVRKIDHAGNIVTVAGTGTAGFAGDGASASAAQLNLPSGLAFDPDGRLYIADSANNRIRMVTVAGVISTVAGDGTPEELLDPQGLAVDRSGAVFVADRGNHRIRKFVRPN
jgi:hypothetical protein